MRSLSHRWGLQQVGKDSLTCLGFGFRAFGMEGRGGRRRWKAKVRRNLKKKWEAGSYKGLEECGAPRVKREKIIHLVWCARWRGDLYLQGRRRKFFPSGVGKTTPDVVHLMLGSLSLQVGFSKATVWTTGGLNPSVNLALCFFSSSQSLHMKQFTN